MQDQRIADLEKQMANKELQWEQERDKILKALKSERFSRKTAEAEKKSIYKELQTVLSSLRNGPSPAQAVQYQLNEQTPNTQVEDLKNQVQKLTSENTDLKNYISSTTLQWEDIQCKLYGALQKHRTKRCEAEATITFMEKKHQDEIAALKQELMDKQQAIESNQRQSSQAQEAEKAREEKFTESSVLFKNKLDRVTLEKNDLITKITSERMAMEEKSMETEARLQNKEAEIIKLKAEYRKKLTAAKVQMEGQLKAKDGRVSELEDQVKILTQQIVKLQVSKLHFEELSQKTDKQKAQMKKAADKVTKEAKKLLAKETKEKEKKAKKEQELLEKQRKEREKQLIKEIKELKRLNEERKLREKKGK